MVTIPAEYCPRLLQELIVREWCICPKPEGSKYPPGVIRPRRTVAQRAVDEAAELERLLLEELW